MISALTKKFVYPLGLKIMGMEERKKAFLFFHGQEFSPLEVNLDIQKQRLYNLLERSIDTIPYYKEIANKNKIKISQKTIYEDLRKFPVLTKQEIRKYYPDIYNMNNTKKFRYNSSGGSTGEPLKLIQDESFIMQSTKWLDTITGYMIGDRVIKLWGSEKEILDNKKDWKRYWIDRIINRTIILNSFKMTENDMYSYVKKINQYKPNTIICYVQSIYEMALFIKKHSLHIFVPERIIVSAGTLYEEMRYAIEAVFKGSKVFNRYGSREVSDIAIECEKQNGLHINLFTQYVEILDENDQPVPPGVSGRIVITNLVNYTMPLIRYDIGDIGVLSEETCPCGRGLPLLKQVKGRTVNQFKLLDGTLIDGEYFTHLFYGISSIEKFQVYQKAYDEVIVYIIIDSAEKDFDFMTFSKNITRKIKLVMEESCDVKVKKVNDIPTLPSGKYVYTYSAIR